MRPFRLPPAGRVSSKDTTFIIAGRNESFPLRYTENKERYEREREREREERSGEGVGALYVFLLSVSRFVFPTFRIEKI